MITACKNDPATGATASNMILRLINCRAPGASDTEKANAVPSTWDWLSEGGLDIEEGDA